MEWGGGGGGGVWGGCVWVWGGGGDAHALWEYKPGACLAVHVMWPHLLLQLQLCHCQHPPESSTAEPAEAVANPA